MKAQYGYSYYHSSTFHDFPENLEISPQILAFIEFKTLHKQLAQSTVAVLLVMRLRQHVKYLKNEVETGYAIKSIHVKSM